MDANIKHRWIEALESGEYQQGTHRLRTFDGGFCCLGVLCDVYSKETGIQWKDGVSPGFGGNIANEFFGSITTLPWQVMDWAGLDTELGHFVLPNGDRTSLSAMNDKGVKFPEIADVIEQFI